METQRIIGTLNRILALEYAGVIQYSQHSFLVQDLFREVYADYFRDSSPAVASVTAMPTSSAR